MLALGLGLTLSGPLSAQAVDEDQLGGWYILQWRNAFENSQWGIQGDIQHRNFDVSEDKEQLLIRAGVTRDVGKYRFALGYAFVDSGAFGPSNRSRHESRIYQELFFATPLGDRLQFSHRFRFEQRWLENQDFRTRLRYGLFLNVPLTFEAQTTNTYLSFYNELFLNVGRDIGQGRRVDYFDRNRLYAGIGQKVSDNVNLQFGYMLQTTDNLDKGQLNFNLIATF
ncbi:MAG: DUF2490 domain-containing protein [Lysobacterales bacterium]